MDDELEAEVVACQVCQQNAHDPPRTAVHQWLWPIQLWLRLHIDFAVPVACFSPVTTSANVITVKMTRDYLALSSISVHWRAWKCNAVEAWCMCTAIRYVRDVKHPTHRRRAKISAMTTASTRLRLYTNGCCIATEAVTARSRSIDRSSTQIDKREEANGQIHAAV